MLWNRSLIILDRIKRSCSHPLHNQNAHIIYEITYPVNRIYPWWEIPCAYNEIEWNQQTDIIIDFHIVQTKIFYSLIKKAY